MGRVEICVHLPEAGSTIRGSSAVHNNYVASFSKPNLIT